MWQVRAESASGHTISNLPGLQSIFSNISNSTSPYISWNPHPQPPVQVLHPEYLDWPPEISWSMIFPLKMGFDMLRLPGLPEKHPPVNLPFTEDFVIGNWEFPASICQPYLIPPVGWQGCQPSWQAWDSVHPTRSQNASKYGASYVSKDWTWSLSAKHIHEEKRISMPNVHEMIVWSKQ